MPRVSVIILTKNRKELLEKCLKSLIKQTYQDFEMIVLDEHSTDGTDQVVHKLMKTHSNLVFVQRDQKGLGYGRNRGVLLAKGEIIAFIDDDEEAHPDWLKEGVRAMDGHDADIVRGAVYYADGSLFRELRTDKLEFPTANIFYKKELIEAIGMFDERFVYCSEDVDLGIRAIEKGAKLVLCADAVTYHVCRSQNPVKKLRVFWRSERFRAMNRVLRYKKHNKYFKKQLFWGLFYRKTHITVIAILISIFILALNALTINNFIIYCTALTLPVLSYMLLQVFVDRNILKYPIRIIFFPYYLSFEVIETFYTLYGAIKYRYFII
jgi:glycosyltransferase involved in cell wall biosynthesis